MDVEQAYALWSDQYDTNENKTRDLEGIALRKLLADHSFESCLEIGCGTGKNTEWLITRAKRVTSVDLSAAMLAKAREKIQSANVEFIQADITKDWSFSKHKHDLISFSLVLEHIEDLEHIFKHISTRLNPGGMVYIGELHPFKQYNGSKARFETEKGTEIVTCFTHNISDFTTLARQKGFAIEELEEFFDEDNRTQIPRIFTLLLRLG
jgi:predicted TPR repeat methyltransferase